MGGVVHLGTFIYSLSFLISKYLYLLDSLTIYF